MRRAFAALILSLVSVQLAVTGQVRHFCLQTGEAMEGCPCESESHPQGDQFEGDACCESRAMAQPVQLGCLSPEISLPVAPLIALPSSASPETLEPARTLPESRSASPPKTATYLRLAQLLI